MPSNTKYINQLPDSPNHAALFPTWLAPEAVNTDERTLQDKATAARESLKELFKIPSFQRFLREDPLAEPAKDPQSLLFSLIALAQLGGDHAVDPSKREQVIELRSKLSKAAEEIANSNKSETVSSQRALEFYNLQILCEFLDDVLRIPQPTMFDPILRAGLLARVLMEDEVSQTNVAFGAEAAAKCGNPGTEGAALQVFYSTLRDLVIKASYPESAPSISSPDINTTAMFSMFLLHSMPQLSSGKALSGEHSNHSPFFRSIQKNAADNDAWDRRFTMGILNTFVNTLLAEVAHPSPKTQIPPSSAPGIASSLQTSARNGTTGFVNTVRQVIVEEILALDAVIKQSPKFARGMAVKLQHLVAGYLPALGTANTLVAGFAPEQNVTTEAALNVASQLTTFVTVGCFTGAADAQPQDPFSQALNSVASRLGLPEKKAGPKNADQSTADVEKSDPNDYSNPRVLLSRLAAGVSSNLQKKALIPDLDQTPAALSVAKGLVACAQTSDTELSRLVPADKQSQFFKEAATTLGLVDAACSYPGATTGLGKVTAAYFLTKTIDYASEQQKAETTLPTFYFIDTAKNPTNRLTPGKRAQYGDRYSIGEGLYDFHLYDTGKTFDLQGQGSGDISRLMKAGILTNPSLQPTKAIVEEVTGGTRFFSLGPQRDPLDRNSQGSTRYLASVKLLTARPMKGRSEELPPQPVTHVNLMGGTCYFDTKNVLIINSDGGVEPITDRRDPLWDPEKPKKSSMKGIKVAKALSVGEWTTALKIGGFINDLRASLPGVTFDVKMQGPVTPYFFYLFEADYLGKRIEPEIRPKILLQWLDIVESRAARLQALYQTITGCQITWVDALAPLKPIIRERLEKGEVFTLENALEIIDAGPDDILKKFCLIKPVPKTFSELSYRSYAACAVANSLDATPGHYAIQAYNEFEAPVMESFKTGVKAYELEKTPGLGESYGVLLLDPILRQPGAPRLYADGHRPSDFDIGTYAINIAQMPVGLVTDILRLESAGLDLAHMRGRDTEDHWEYYRF